jgi:hypothetical protein
VHHKRSVACEGGGDELAAVKLHHDRPTNPACSNRVGIECSDSARKMLWQCKQFVFVFQIMDDL